MLGAISSIPETIKNWRDHRDLLYPFVTAISAALVLAALTGKERPSDILARVAHWLGLTSVANWFSIDAPPALAYGNPDVQSLALWAFVILVAGMVAVPLWRSRHDDNEEFGYETLRLVGSPAASTTWVLLLIATQQGDITSRIPLWDADPVVVSFWTITGLLGAGTLVILIRRWGLGRLFFQLISPAAVFLFRLLIGLVAAGFAVLVAAVAFPLSIIAWATTLESDSSRKIRSESARQRANRALQPTGAPVTSVYTDERVTPAFPVGFGNSGRRSGG